MRLVLYTDAVEYGGAERMLANLVIALRTDIEIVVAGVDRVVVDAVAATRADGLVTASPLALLRLVGRRPAIVQVNLRTPYSCAGAQLAATSHPQVRTISVEHLPLASSSRARRRLKRFLSRRLAAHVAVSNATARAVEAEAELPPGSIRTIHNGVPDPGLVPLRKGSVDPALAVIGRLDRQKGLDVLLDALIDVPDVAVAVVGDGPQRTALTAQAERLGLAARVTFLGWRDDVAAELARVDALVLPSRAEGLPLVVLEAMLAGVPVLATDVGGVRECLEPEQTGLLVPPEDAGALAKALRRLLGDAELRARLAAAARERALECHTTAVMAARYERLYAELIAG